MFKEFNALHVFQRIIDIQRIQKTKDSLFVVKYKILYMIKDRRIIIYNIGNKIIPV